jgi:hypothetical protein
MSRVEGVVWCDNCGVEITWAPLVQVGTVHHHLLHICCQECLEGNPCRCAERMELEEIRKGHPSLSGWDI